MQNRTLTVCKDPGTPPTPGLFISIMSILNDVLKEVRFSPNEKIVMDAIHEKGEYVWNSYTDRHFQITLKNLMWKSMIQRKPQYGNVFIAGTYGKIANDHNQDVRELKESFKKHGKQ